jgi:uncharacterized protein YbjT (DUF2867 family)
MIAVVGGTGTLGSAAVTELLARGESVRIISRNRPESVPGGADHRAVDLAAGGGEAGPGLTEAIDGAATVIDAANNSTRPGPVMLDGSARLMAACCEAGVGHFVGVSIVGCERVGVGYYKAKAKQEELVRASPVPWSLLRATQFHELLDGAFSTSAKVGFLPGGDIPLQPIAASAAGAELAAIASGPPLEGSREVAGPAMVRLREAAALWLDATGRRRLRLPVPMIGRIGRAIGDGAFTLPGEEGPGPDFREWLAGRYGISGE